MSIQPGERIPEAILQYVHDGVQKIDTSSLFEGNKTVLFAVPGAFTPTCSERHLPGYVEHFDEFKRRGINVACMAVNDAFVMEAWGESQHVPEGLRMLSDGNGEFAKALSGEKVNAFFRVEKEFNGFLQKEMMERRQNRIDRNRIRQK